MSAQFMLSNLPPVPKFRLPCLSSLASPWEVFFTSFGYFIFLLLWYVTVCIQAKKNWTFNEMWYVYVAQSHSVQKLYMYVHIRYLSRFFDRGAHETMYAYIGNKHFFTKSCHCQTYQNSKISWQKMPISDFQSEFSMSKIIRIFLIFFPKMTSNFCQLILEFW